VILTRERSGRGCWAGRAGVQFRPMIHPAPTTRLDPILARGTLLEVVQATATLPGYIRFTVPNSSYDLHLIPTAPILTEPGRRLIGTIHAKARRIDKVKTGGRFVEPVYGRPRRVQGAVVAVDAANNIIVVNAGVPIHITPTDQRQTAGDFEVGQFVGFDVFDGATFTAL
jgi:hypothetical protein